MNKKDLFIMVLSIIVVIVCSAYFFWISGTGKATQNHNIGEVKTALIAALMLVLNYWFGSSRGSATKDETIKNLKEKTEVNVGTTESTDISVK